jgi:CubicO group peptidase (beta-lactamase class C family)
MRKPALIVLAICFVLPLKLLANDKVLDQLPEFVEEGMSAWHVPGMAVAVLSDEKILFQQGFGKTAVKGGKKVDAHTQFAIASTTKAMVAASIMMLVDEKKLALDDLAIQHLPELQFGETWLNSQITVRDMLTHRTGLGSTDFWAFFQGTPLEEQISLLKNVEPSASLRSRFQYQNTMFELMGEIIERNSGMPWNEFVSERLWQPLDMNETYASRGRIDRRKEHVLPYQYLNDELSQARWNLDPDLADAAGSVWSSVSDMGRWAQFLLRGGVTEENQRLISEESFAELFKPQMLVAPADFYPTTEITKPHWTTYGLGWFQQDFQGRKIDFHTGSLSGLIAMIGLDRENDRAVIILGNRDHAEMRHAILWQVMDHQPAESRTDWNAEILALYDGQKKQQEDEWQKTVNERLPGTKTGLPIENYAGTYRHAAYGDLKVEQSENGMTLKSGKVQIELSHWHLDTFLVEQKEEGWKFLLPFNIGSKANVLSMDLFGLIFMKQEDPRP